MAGRKEYPFDGHVLLVEDGDWELDERLEVEHPPTCRDRDDGGFRCFYDYTASEVGLFYALELADEDPDALAPGRYTLAHWTEEHYSHYYGVTEWEEGLVLGDRLPADPGQATLPGIEASAGDLLDTAGRFDTVPAS